MDELTRRYANVREALARDGLDAAIVCGSEYTRLRGRGHVHERLHDRAPLRVRAAPARGRADDRLPVRGALRRRARRLVDRGAGLRRPAGRVARRATARQARRRLRPRLRDDRARLRRAAPRPRTWSRGTCEFDHARAVKSEAELESVRDSVRINTDGFHAFREAYAPGKTAAEVDGAGGGALRRARLRPPDDEHGARRRRVRARARRRRRSATSASRRSRSPAPAATGSRSRARSARRAPR